jgi:hypothetical protein
MDRTKVEQDDKKKKPDGWDAWGAGLDAQIPDSFFSVIILIGLYIGTAFIWLITSKKWRSQKPKKAER